MSLPSQVPASWPDVPETGSRPVTDDIGSRPTIIPPGSPPCTAVTGSVPVRTETGSRPEIRTRRSVCGVTAKTSNADPALGANPAFTMIATKGSDAVPAPDDRAERAVRSWAASNEVPDADAADAVTTVFPPMTTAASNAAPGDRKSVV